MDLRLEAESRILRQSNSKQSKLNQDSAKRPRYKLKIDSSDKFENLTPQKAESCKEDYILNGSRARARSGEFVRPRYIPDAEAFHCFSCNSEFDWWTRRHHCRCCGRIFCFRCICNRSLLPHEFGECDPQKVCQACNEELLPQQVALRNNIANHQRINVLDITSNGLRRYFNFPISLTLGSEIRKASYSTLNLFKQQYYIKDRTIPFSLLSNAKGLAFITVIKGGVFFAAQLGTGLVIAHLPQGTWSAPSAIGTLGVSYGALVGAEVTDYVIVLNSDDAVSAFASGSQVSFGASADIAVGPLGRSGRVEMNFGDGGCGTAITYSQSRGLYAGLSLEGSAVFSRPDVNHRFYGRALSPMELLKGVVEPPRAARSLYDALDEAMAALPQPIYRALSASRSERSSHGPSGKTNYGSYKSQSENSYR